MIQAAKQKKHELKYALEAARLALAALPATAISTERKELQERVTALKRELSAHVAAQQDHTGAAAAATPKFDETGNRLCSTARMVCIQGIVGAIFHSRVLDR